uniref:Probable E3 ubiquitin-protein ligase sinah n=1 Tax=Cacopsylla melanoneura TaxID=428564 RepID=A0A8D9FED6_9HEMI
MGPPRSPAPVKVKEEEFQPSLRLCHVERPSQGSCGFHLSRTQWDPYPWVSGVEAESAAEAAGLVVWDCVLEVNGEDVLGLRIGEVAVKVKAKEGHVKLLVWNAGPAESSQTAVSNQGPTPLSLQRLAVFQQSVIQLLECPVCLENISPPVTQCYNGHLICSPCRTRSEKCPICRVALGNKGRCLLADKLHLLLINTFAKSKPLPSSKLKKFCKTNNTSSSIKPPLQLKSRLKETLSMIQDLHIDKIDTETTDPLDKEVTPSGEPAYYCPYGKSCGQLLRPVDLGPHIRHGHCGPLVQFHSSTGRVQLHLPVLDLVCICAYEVTFYLHLTKHLNSGHNTMWLWMEGDPAQAAQFRFKFSMNLFVLNGNVFSLSTRRQDILALRSQECVKLSDDILDNNSNCNIEIIRNEG